jgi:putative hydrolase of the HAD superfamily
MMGPFGYGNFLRQFHGIYYSHHMGMRKPEAAFFEKVLTDQKLKAESVLFIDDTDENIRAAENLGINCWHFKPEKDSLSDLGKVLSAHRW